MGSTHLFPSVIGDHGALGKEPCKDTRWLGNTLGSAPPLELDWQMSGHSAAGHLEGAFGERRHHLSTVTWSCWARSSPIGAASTEGCHSLTKVRASQHGSPTTTILRGPKVPSSPSHGFYYRAALLFDYFPPNPRAEWENKAFCKLSLGEKYMPHHHGSAK